MAEIGREIVRARAQVSAAAARALQRPPMHLVIPEEPEAGVEVLGPTAEQKAEVRKWEAEQLAGIEEWGREARAKVAAYEVPVREEVRYEGLTPEEERIVKEYGPEEVIRRRTISAEREAVEEFKKGNIQLPSGEWIAKKDFAESPLEVQTKIRELGVTGYNRWVEQENLKIEAEQRKFEAAHIKVGTDPETGKDLYVPKEDWNRLTPAQQKEARETGSYTVETPTPGAVAERFIEIGTPVGKQAIPEAEWEGYSDVEKLAIALGKAPTREEYRAYSLERELGIRGHPFTSWVPTTIEKVPILGPVAIGMAEFFGRAVGPVTFLATGVEKLVPGGVDFWTKYHRAEAAALERWEEQYPEMRGIGELVSPLEAAGFPAARVAYPQITRKEITPIEWGATGLNIALLTAPVWIPPTVRGIKVTGTKIGGLGGKVPTAFSRLTARLGTWPYSEAPGLRRAPPPTKAPLTSARVTTIGPKELGISEIGFNRIFESGGYQALERFSKLKGRVPGLTPENFIVLDTLERQVKPPMPVKPIPKYSPKLAEVAKQKIAAEKAAEYYRSWQAGRSKIWARPETRTLEQIARQRALTQEGMRLAAEAARRVRGLEVPKGWTTTPAGRFMPAGARPILLPDIPVMVNIAPKGLPAKYVIKTVPAEEALTPTRPAIKVEPKTKLEAQVLQRMREMLRVKTIAEVAVTTKIQPTVTTKIQPAVVTKVMPFTSPLTRLQPQTMTQVETETMTRIQSMTGLQPAVVTKLMPAEVVQTQIQLQTQLGEQTQILTKLQQQLKTETRTQEKQKIQEKIQQQQKIQEKIKEKLNPRIPIPWPKKEGAPKPARLPEGTVVWQQGVVKKVVPPPYSGIKPFTEYNPVPKGMGKPSETFRIIGRPTIEGEVDLGVTDIEFNGGIRFRGGGLRTDVGKRHPSPSKGMTIRYKGKKGQFVRF